MNSFPDNSQALFFSADNIRFCSFPVGNSQKIHFYSNGDWQRLATLLSADCSESISYAERKHGIWRLSLIAGNPADSKGPVLYRILSEAHLPTHDSEILNMSAVSHAACGFAAELLTVYSEGENPVRIIQEKQRKTVLNFRDIQKYTRIFLNPCKEKEIILHGILKTEAPFIRKFNLATGKAYEIRQECFKQYIPGRELSLCIDGKGNHHYIQNEDIAFIELDSSLFSLQESPKCKYMEDTGRKAFVNIPCRGNAIICRHDGHLTYTHNCNDTRCRNFIPAD